MDLEIYEYLIGNYTKDAECNSKKIYKKNKLGKLTSKINKKTNSYYLFHNTVVDNTNNHVCSDDPIGNKQFGGWDYDRYLFHYNEISPKRKVENVYDKIRKIYDINGQGKKLFIKLLKKAKIINQRLFGYSKDNQDEKKGFIYKLKVRPHQKIIIFGDFHGSFHGFLRNIQRFIALGVITLKNDQFIINPNYIILFCGDVFDRGLSAELFIIILKLIINNEGKIIFNRGNHETFEIFGQEDQQTLIYELKKKMSLTKFEFDQLATCLKNFVTSCPTAVSVEYDQNNKIWCCHGGVPILDCFDDQRITEELKGTNITLFKNEKVCDIQSILKNNNIIELNIPLATQIRWNDLNLNFDESKELGKNIGRGKGVNISKKSIDKFLSLNGYKFLVRGHQDSLSNTVLFGKTLNMTGGNNKQKKGGSYDSFIQSDKSKIGDCIQEIIKKTYSITINKPLLSNLESKINLFKLTSPVGRIQIINNKKIIMNLNKKEKEVNFEGNTVTISNNSDCGRTLVRDSFLLLSKISNNRVNDTVLESEQNLWTKENMALLTKPTLEQLLITLSGSNKSGGSIKKKKSKKKTNKIIKH